MKEVCAIIRRDKVEATKRALEEIGFPSMTMQSVEGRGKQRGSLVEQVDTELSDFFRGNVKIVPTPSTYALEHSLPKPALYVPKKMLVITVPDDSVKIVVETIIAVNKTNKAGDGKIFVLPIEGVVRVRTGEKGEKAIQ